VEERAVLGETPHLILLHTEPSELAELLSERAGLHDKRSHFGAGGQSGWDHGLTRRREAAKLEPLAGKGHPGPQPPSARRARMHAGARARESGSIIAHLFL